MQVKSPPKAGAFKERPAKPTSFRKFYDRGDFPIALEHDTKGNKIAWKVSVQLEHMGENVVLRCGKGEVANGRL